MRVRRVVPEWSCIVRRSSVGQPLLDRQSARRQAVGDARAGAGRRRRGDRPAAGRGACARGSRRRSRRGRDRRRSRSRRARVPAGAMPMFTAGTPRNEHSRIATLELPTIAVEWTSSRRKSSGNMLRNRWKLSGCSRSRKTRMPFDVPSEPASTFGQNHSTGSPTSLHRVERLVHLLRAPPRTRSSPDAASRRDSPSTDPRCGPTPPYFSNGSKSSAGLRRDLRGDVDRRAAGEDDRVRVLAQPDHALARQLRRHEVQVRQLRDRVADLLVDRAGDLAALHVDDRDVHVGRGHGRRERLVAVGDRDHRVGLAGCRTRWPAPTSPRPVDLADVTRFSPSSTM